MGHVQHFDSQGNKTPSVSEIPGIFAHDMSGFEDWICRGMGPHECCTKAKRAFYEESANLGNDIHNLREAFLEGKPFDEGVPEYQAHVFEPVAQFYKTNQYKPLFIETQMTGKTYGGSLDGAGTFGVPFWEEQRKTFWDKHSRWGPNDMPNLPTTDSIWIEDLKIKSKLDVLHPLQLYGYMLLLKEVHGIDAEWGLIIRREKKLEKRPEIQLRGYYLPAYEEQWNASMLMWKFLND